MISICLFASTCDCRRLQDCKERRCLEWNENFKKLEELVRFLQEYTGACILFEFCKRFWTLQITRQSSQSTRNTASFETKGKFNTNLIGFLSTMALLSILSGAHIPHTPNGKCIWSSSQWQCHFVWVAGVVAVVFAFTFYFEIPNPIHQQWHPFPIDPGTYKHIPHSQR
jgi:hypothetical protein